MAPGGTLSSVEVRIARIAGRQHGVITLLQLLAAGLSRKQITHRLHCGRLHRLHHGVYAVGYAAVSYEAKALAAVLACASGAGLSHLHAASAYEVSRFRRPVLIDVVVPKQRRDKQGVRVHHRANLLRSDLTIVNRIPVARPARMLVDLSDTLTPHQLANVIHRCAYRDLFDAAATRAVSARTARTKTIERALQLHASGSAGTRSHGEDRFLALCRVEPRVNTVLLDEEVDFFWPDHRIVVEIDGPNHGRPATSRDDARRDAKLRAAGLDVIRLGDSGLDRLARQGAAKERPELVALVR
jgi:very-short-patch-repair endonuclease